ncbi:MAG: methyltransferase family protein [Bacillota bacterium]
MDKTKLTKSGIRAAAAPFRWLFVTALSFFLAAGRADILRAWIYIGVYFVGSLYGLYIFVSKVPGLANERGEIKKGTKKWDIPIILLFFMLAILITPITAGLDIRNGLTYMNFSFLYLGIALYLVSLVFSMWPILHNPFFEGTVRMQKDRNQTVISTGPYRIVRHPGYLGMLTGAFPLPLALGSVASLIPAAIMAVLVVIRTFLEDKTLQEELPGYKAYCKSVRYRLIPYIW